MPSLREGGLAMFVGEADGPASAVIAGIAYKIPEDLSEIPGSYELDAPSTDAL